MARLVGWIGLLLGLLSVLLGCGSEISEKLQHWDLPLDDPPYLLSNNVLAIHETNDGALWFGTGGGGVSRFDPISDQWQNYTREQGLANNDVLVIHQSGDGALWFGTAGGGVSRFDPTSGLWQTYTRDQGLADNFIMAIHETGGGVLWFGTLSGGVSHFDPASGLWQTYTRDQGLANNAVLAIHQSGDGTLWFGTGGGVSRFNPASGQWQTHTYDQGLAADYVQAIHETGDGALWFGTFGGGVSRFDPASGQWQTYTRDQGLADNFILAIHETGGGVLWFGTNGGVSRFDQASGQWQTYTRDQGLADNNVRTIYETGGSVLWFGTRNGGVSRFDPASDQWQSYTRDQGLADNAVWAIHQSGDGALWFATRRGGVSRFDLASGQWQTYSRNQGLADNFVQTIHQTGDGTLWFGTFEGGVSHFDPASDQWQTYTHAQGLADNNVQTIHRTGDGTLWFGTFEGGVSHFDPASDQWQTYTHAQGLADNNVQTIHQSDDGTLWFGTGNGGVSRFDPASSQWQSYTRDQGLADNDVQTIHETGDGTLWFGTFRGGVSHFDPASGQWQAYTHDQGLADNNVQSIYETGDGALWFGTFGGGASRFDPASGQWQTYTRDQELTDNFIQVIHETGDGALWFGTFEGGISRFRYGNNPEAGAVVTFKALPDYRPILLNTYSKIVRTRPTGLVFSILSEAIPVASQEPILVLALGPEGTVWAGERFGGLHLRRSTSEDLQLTKADGLPAMHVNTIVSLPEQEGHKVWAGTSGGAALVSLSDKKLQVERTLTIKNGLPSGPVAALAAQADGSVFLAFNKIEPKLILNDELAERRTSSRVYFVPADGEPSEPLFFFDNEQLPNLNIRALTLLDGTLWAATSAGLFKADNPQAVGARMQRVTAPGSPQFPVRQLKTNLNTNELWMIADAQEDAPVRVVGYDPVGDQQFIPELSNQGQPSTLPIHDLDITEKGELVVLAGALVFKGFIKIGSAGWMNPYTFSSAFVLIIGLTGIILIFFNPLVRELKANPEQLPSMSLAEIDIALKRLRRAWALREIWQRLNLSERRLALVKTLISQHSLPSIATLLGMKNASDSDLHKLQTGLQWLPMRLDYPEKFQEQAIALIGVDTDAIASEDETVCRSEIKKALEHSGQDSNLPFLLVCRDADQGRRLLPDGYRALIIDEPMLRQLLFAPQPAHTLAGMLLTRGLLALSPYSHQGEVRNPLMFYGRERLLEEFIQTELPQFLLVGPRRVGKSSLLRRLRDKLNERHSASNVVFLDLLGVSEPVKAAQLLARRLDQPRPQNITDTEAAIAYIDEILRQRFSASKQPTLILIDEADALIETDTAADFPLLNRLRSLKAEGVCSFILAGFWYLFRHTLNHDSPVYNFAPVKQLGPLSQHAGLTLASEPMTRIGISYADKHLPQRIFELTGGYPSLVQMLCEQLLHQTEQDLTLQITSEHLQQVESSQYIRDQLSGFFRMNTGHGAQLMVYGLLEKDSFKTSEAHQTLQQSVGKDVPSSVIDQILLQLKLYGLVTETSDGYRWAIPLVRNILLRDGERDYRIEQLLKELSADFAGWITPRDGTPS